jgi:porin
MLAFYASAFGGEPGAALAAKAPPPGWLERDTLTADWFGSGASLREQGINFTGSLANFYQGLASGDGDDRWKYGGKADLFLRLDGGKLGWAQGFGVSAHGELNFGQSSTSAGGTFLPNNTALLLPGANDTVADLSLYVSQQLGGSVTVLFGKINTIDLYDGGREFSGGRGIEQFAHVMFVAPLSGITPPMIFGGVVSVKTQPAKFTLMVYDPANQTRWTGFEHPFGSGVTFNGSMELASDFFGKSGKHVFSAAYTTKDSTDFSDPYLLLPTTPPPGTKDGYWYFAYAFEQTLWRDAADARKAWGLFGQVAVSDADANPVGWSALVGLGGTSPIPGRERDKFGAGTFYVGYSSGLKDGLRLAGFPARDEYGLEVFYNLALTPWLRVTADAQVIRPPRADRDTALIAGLRAVINF